ncbi:uncharacterized protein LOC101848996 [Aplysia californica]|uniref:Uncharacterized protein LOC101848996 n=1 Tax=Aplysia californica TaxID=6500 RepID=A0ABM1W0A6_APLCA|nr:uncharacterized protein LOC101848996 [Aplysia californica]
MDFADAGGSADCVNADNIRLQDMAAISEIGNCEGGGISSDVAQSLPENDSGHVVGFSQSDNQKIFDITQIKGRIVSSLIDFRSEHHKPLLTPQPAERMSRLAETVPFSQAECDVPSMTVKVQHPYDGDDRIEAPGFDVETSGRALGRALAGLVDTGVDGELKDEEAGNKCGTGYNEEPHILGLSMKKDCDEKDIKDCLTVSVEGNAGLAVFPPEKCPGKGESTKRLTVKATKGNSLSVTIASVIKTSKLRRRKEIQIKEVKESASMKKIEEPKRKSGRNKEEKNKGGKDLMESRLKKDNKKKEESQREEGKQRQEAQKEDGGLCKSRRSLRLKAGKKISYVNDCEFEEEEDETERQFLPPEMPSAASPTLSPSSALSPPLVPPSVPSKDLRLVPSAKGYKCYLCDFTSKSSLVLKQHREVCHGEKPFCCAHCSYSCRTKSDLTKHEHIHLPEHTYRCTECNYTGKRLRYLQKHMKIHQEGNVDGEEEKKEEEFPFSCHICEFRCNSKSELDSHLPSHSKQFRKYVCAYCGLPFRHKAPYTRHLAVHPEACPYICTLCGSAFKKKSLLLKHEQSHKSEDQMENGESNIVNKDNTDLGDATLTPKAELEDKRVDKKSISDMPVKRKKVKVKKKKKNVTDAQEENSEILYCELCSYSTTQKSLLRSHKRKHSDAKPHKCHQCGASFKRRYHLTRHRLSHNADAPKFPCPHCPYSTFRKHRLKVHIQTHQTNKPIKCSLCPYSCRHEWTLKYHMRKHTGNTAPGKSGQPAKIDFTCHLCGYQCKNTKNMKYHMMRHDNKTPYTCPHCDYKCSSKSSIKDHLLQHAGLKPYLCSDCGKSFRNASRLSRHKLVHSDMKPYSCDHCDFSSRSKYNLRQHILRHTDKDKVKRRVRNKTTVRSVSKPEANGVGSQLLKLNFQSDIQSLLGQNNYLENIHPEPFGGQMNTGFPALPLAPSDQGSGVIPNIDGIEKTLSSSMNPRSDTMYNNKNFLNKDGQMQTLRNQNTMSMFAGFEPNHERFNSPSTSNAVPTAGNVGFDMNPSVGGFNPLVGHNDASIAYNTYPHIPPPHPPNANFSGMDRGGGYSYMNPYFYNETVFPGYMSSNMNFYLGQSNMDTGHLNAGLDLRRHYDISQASEPTMTNHMQVDKDVNALRMPAERTDVVSVGDANMAATRTFLESPSVFMGGGEKVFQKELGVDESMAVSSKPDMVPSDISGVTASEVMPSSTAASLNFLDSAVSAVSTGDDYNSLKVESNEENLGCNDDDEEDDDDDDNEDVDFPPMLSDAPEEQQQDSLSEIPPQNDAVQPAVSPQVENKETVEKEGKEAETTADTNDPAAPVQHSPFFCTECGLMCETRAILQKHRRTHATAKPHTCEHCGKAFKRKDHMRAHMHTHSTEKPFKCSQCSYACNRKYRLRRHELSHTEERAHRCKDCGKSFDTEEEVINHAELHAAGFMYECDVDHCAFRCKSKSELKAHAKVHQVFLCEKCSYSCTSAAEFANHKRVHHQEKKELICSVCGYVCDSNKRLKYHMARHENKTPHSCPHCDYKCSSRSSLTDHLLNHEGIKPFLCSICGMRFRNTSRLNRHKLVHSDVKPHSCEYCSFSSRSKYNLKQHMLRHFKNDLAPASSSAATLMSQKKDHLQLPTDTATATTISASASKPDFTGQSNSFRMDNIPASHPALRTDLPHFSAAAQRTDYLAHPPFRNNLHMPPALQPPLIPHPGQSVMGHPV